MTVEQIMAEIVENDFNVTFSGGDPLYQDPEALLELATAIRDAGYTLWCYTGFVYEEIKDNPRYTALLPLFETVVDGPFVEALRDTSLIFRGSSNQRLIRPSEF